MPTANKIELFARNNNLREGWLSLGNQLGENYIQWKNIVNCDECKKQIELGTKRYKSKIIANKDVCEHCFKDLSLRQTDFFLLENSTDEDILHEYLKCNICHAEPIWGPRFKCQECEDMDVCEQCFDTRLTKLNVKSTTTKSKNNKGHLNDLLSSTAKESKEIFCQGHNFDCIELPLLANGLAAHND